ncbi:hypothetical protein JXA40_01890 [bacterium]|nr:hypothetical protein [candidate division CSSED10-310 bacterium]
MHTGVKVTGFQSDGPPQLLHFIDTGSQNHPESVYNDRVTPEIRQIITHQHPDLDAILSVLLLKRFGEPLFPGVSKAPVIFHPANECPSSQDGMSLEDSGVLAVDIGGGRFDNHPVTPRRGAVRKNRCAADLVASELGLTSDPGWKDLIEFTRQHDTRARGILSADFLHHLPTIPTILTGLSILAGDGPDSSAKILDAGMQLIEAVYAHITRKDTDPADMTELLSRMAGRYLTEREINPDDPPKIFKNFVLWSRRLAETPETAFSSDTLDRLISLSSLVSGFHALFNGDPDRIWMSLRLCFDAILARENQWIEALDEIDRVGRFVNLRRNIRIGCIQSENGMVIKAARFRGRVDMVVYRDPVSGATSLILNRRGPLKGFDMRNMAAKIRIAECIERNESLSRRDLRRLGTVHGWFLHQSENLLICGSPKASTATPSKIPLDDLLELCITEIDWCRRLPARYCPANGCTRQDCLFYPEKFKSCLPVPP